MEPSSSHKPRGRAFQARIMLVSASMSFAALVLISAYLSALLRLTPSQWGVFAGIVAGWFVVLFALQAWSHERVWRPLIRCLDARAEGRATPTDLAEGFRAIAGLPKQLFFWGEFWWVIGGLLVAGSMGLLVEGFRLASAFSMVVAAISGGFVMGFLHFFVLKDALAPMRLQLAEELSDPELRSQLVERLSIRKKLVGTVAGTTCVVVLFAALLSSVEASRAVESSTVTQQVRLLERIVRDYRVRGESAIADGALLAAELQIADAVMALSADAEEVGESGIELGELLAMREIGLEQGDSLSFDSSHILTWRRLPDGRVLVLRTDWRVVQGMADNGGYVFVLFLLVSLGISLVTGRILADDITAATRILSVEADRMAIGDLRSDSVWEGEDELGDLARSFDAMRASLRQTVARVSDAADRVESSAGELSPVATGISTGSAAQVEAILQAAGSMEEIDAQVRGIAASSATLNESVEESSSSVLELGASGQELNETAVRLHESIEEVSISMEQLKQSVSKVSGSTEELSEAAEETSASMEEMASSLREVDSSAGETSRLSEEVVERAESGQEKVRETIEGMERIQVATEIAEEVIRGLHGRTVEIGAIVDVIDDVADETNLLALNAAIIAAQAGEHGRAFSVVAGEIKDLAERVLVSTKEIGGLISAVQDGAVRATSAIEEGTSSVANGVERSAEAGMALEAITRAARQSGTRMGGIVDAVQAQSKAAIHVVTLMEKVRIGVDQIRDASIEQGSGQAVVSQNSNSMRDVAQQVRETTAEQAHGSSRIRESIDGVSHAVDQINNALHEQSQACAAVLAGLETVQSRTHANQEVALTLDDVTQTLRSNADALRAEVDRFQI